MENDYYLVLQNSTEEDGLEKLKLNQRKNSFRRLEFNFSKKLYSNSPFLHRGV